MSVVPIGPKSQHSRMPVELHKRKPIYNKKLRMLGISNTPCKYCKTRYRITCQKWKCHRIKLIHYRRSKWNKLLRIQLILIHFVRMIQYSQNNIHKLAICSVTTLVYCSLIVFNILAMVIISRNVLRYPSFSTFQKLFWRSLISVISWKARTFSCRVICRDLSIKETQQWLINFSISVTIL